MGDAAIGLAATLDWLLAGTIALAFGGLLGVRLLAPVWQPRAVLAGSRAALALLALLFAAWLPLSALVLSEAALADLPAATWLVLWQAHQGAMWRLGAAGLLLAGTALAGGPGAASAALTAPAAPAGWRDLALAGGLLMFLLAKADTGHGAEHGLASPLVWMHALHVGSACAWAGSVLVAWLRLRGAAAAWPDALLLRPSQVAAVCLAAVSASGLVNLWRLLGHATGGLGDYGLWLALKLALAGAASGSGCQALPDRLSSTSSSLTCGNDR